MPQRRDHAARPLRAGQRHQFFKLFVRFSGDADIGDAVAQQRGNLHRAAFAQGQPHLRIPLGEARHHRGQRVTRLGVRGGDDQRAAAAGIEFAPDLAQVVGVAQDALGDVEHDLARLGQCGDAFAFAHEYGHAEFFLQQADLFADARLRGKQRFRGIRDLQSVAGDFAQIA